MKRRYTVRIEIPRDCKVKYEWDIKAGRIAVDRILKVKYPFNYGFLLNTLWLDGDPLDAIVIGDFSLHPGTCIKAEPIAVVKMEDNGHSDDKVILRFGDEKLAHYESVIVGFLKSYKKARIRE